MSRVWLTAGLCAALLGAVGASSAMADAGASGKSPDLVQALLLREGGDSVGATRHAEAALAKAQDDATRWEALLARTEIDIATGALARAEPTARSLLLKGETIFGARAPRLAGPLVALAQVRAAQGDDAAATSLFLRAARLARAGYNSAQGPDGVPRGDPQVLADFFATLAALAEHLLQTGEGRAAALLAAELALQGGEAPAGLPPRWQDAVAIGALAHLRAGRPVEALTRAAPLFRLGHAPQTARARRLLDELVAEVDAAAVAEGDPVDVTDRWIAAALDREAEIAGSDTSLVTGMGPVMEALAAGDAVQADAAARVALASVRTDDPLVTTAYLTLLGTTLRAGREDLAEAWALRIAEMPPAYLASLDADPLPLLAGLAAELRSDGALPGAIAVGEAVAVLAPLRAAAGEEDTTISALTQLATTYTDAGKYREAGEMLDRALVLVEDERARGPLRDGLAEAAISARVGRALLRQDLGDPDAAVADLDAARDLLLTTGEGGKPEAWLFVGAALRDAHAARGDAPAAEAALREVTERVTELAGDPSAPAAEGWFELAQFLVADGRVAEAADPIRRAVAATRAALPPDDPLSLRVAVLEAAAGGGAGDLLAVVGRGGETAALALAEAAASAASAGDTSGAVAFLDSGIAALDAAAPARAYFEAGKGALLLRSGDPEGALPALREATRALTRAERRGEPNARRHLPAHVAAALALSAATEGVASLNAFTEAFQVAQRVDDLSAGSALGRATARLLGSGPQADALARQLETAERELEASREAYLARLSLSTDVTAPRQAFTAAQSRLDEVREAVRATFPDYAGLADPRPHDLLSTARLLGPDEVLLLYATANDDGPDEPSGHVFAITSEGYLAAPLPPRGELRRIARSLRCAAALTDRRCGLGGGVTRGAFSLATDGDTASGEFDFALARDAWDALFAPIEAALEGKTSLIVVPDRTLSSMPFHLALSEPADAGTTLRSAPWLLRRMAVTVVPSVASLAALRNRDARPSAADLAFLGVGDPLIGTQSAGPLPYDCGGAGEEMLLAEALVPPAGPILRDAGTADPVALAALPALPDTRCELQHNAALFGDTSKILIQGAATEASIKAMSARGDLARFRILSFATHGLIAGEVGASNAGLVLTPPARPEPGDDGLLTTSEIAELRIDADFVILSACNTASGSSDSSEGLAGLASAFFLAGARGLLVSHWPVYSDAATELTTGMVTALAGPDRPGRAEALRSSVLSILDDPASSPRQLHPAYWAPFMVVGDGRPGQG